MLKSTQRIQSQKQSPASSTNYPQQIQKNRAVFTDLPQENTKASNITVTEGTSVGTDTSTNVNIGATAFIPNTDINNIFIGYSNPDTSNASNMYGQDYIFDFPGYDRFEMPFLKDQTLKNPLKCPSGCSGGNEELETFSGFDPLFKDELKLEKAEKETLEFFENLGKRLEENIAQKNAEAESLNAVKDKPEDKSEEKIIVTPDDNEELKELKEEIFKVENLILELSNMNPKVEKTDVTNEVFMTTETKYLIKKNGVEYAFADELKVAISIVNSIANDEVKKLRTDKMHVFLRSDRDDCRVQIYTQSIGVIMNSYISKNTVYEVFPVKRIFYVHQEPVGLSKEEVKRFVPDTK